MARTAGRVPVPARRRSGVPGPRRRCPDALSGSSGLRQDSTLATIVVMELATVVGASALYIGRASPGRSLVYRYGRFIRPTQATRQRRALAETARFARRVSRSSAARAAHRHCRRVRCVRGAGASLRSGDGTGRTGVHRRLHPARLLPGPARARLRGTDSPPIRPARVVDSTGDPRVVDLRRGRVGRRATRPSASPAIQMRSGALAGLFATIASTLR